MTHDLLTATYTAAWFEGAWRRHDIQVIPIGRLDVERIRRAGSETFWILFPPVRERHSASGFRIYNPDGSLFAEELFRHVLRADPGMECRVEIDVSTAINEPREEEPAEWQRMVMGA